MLPLPFDDAMISWILGGGCVVTIILAIVLVSKYATSVKDGKDLKVFDPLVPRWMRYMRNVFIFYVILNSVIICCMNNGIIPMPDQFKQSFGEKSDPIQWSSAFWMLFYCISICLYYAALQAWYNQNMRQCLNGHLVHLSAATCEKCGEQLQPVEDAGDDSADESVPEG